MVKSKDILRQITMSKQNQLESTRRRGPKPKLIKDRVCKLEDMRPILHPKRFWSQRQKIRVLVFLYHYRIPLNINLLIPTTLSEYRAPTQDEASKIFGVPQTTISEWVRKQHEIETHGSTSSVRSPRKVTICQWPELEERLYELFLSRRDAGQAIRRGWFRVFANEIYRELYPNAQAISSLFRFSNGWFEKFLRRFRISLRCITKKAQKIPQDYYSLVINWLQFNRRNSQPRPNYWMETVLSRAIGRYHLSNICNLDETPLPFEYLSGRTYDKIGSNTIWVKETRSGWDKRQASLVLCVFADGVNRISPLIIFHGLGERLRKEKEKYHPGVIVEFNEKAYMNENLFLKYIKCYLIPALQQHSGPSLFAFDLCPSHKTPTVLNNLRNHQVMPSLIPAGCTSLVQPLDVSINKPLKERIRDLTDEAIYESENGDIGRFEKWTIGDRRVLTTCCVGDAWYEFCIEKQDLVKRIFRKVGLSLPIDGSADHELDIKGFQQINIGDWKQTAGSDDDNTRVGIEFGSLSSEADQLYQLAEISEDHDDNDSVEFLAYGELQ